jgi:hypothetical protein
MRSPRALLVVWLVGVAACSTGSTAASRRAAPCAPPAGDAASPDPGAAAAPTASVTSGRGRADPLNLPVTHRPAGGRATDASARRPAQEDDAFFAAKLSAARDEVSAGREEQALEILLATLRLEPPSPWDGRIRAMRLEIRERQVGVDALRVDARGERDYVPFDADVYLVLRVRNVGTSDVVIRAPEGEGTAAISGAAFVLTVQRIDRDVYGGEMRRSWTQNVPLVTAATGPLRIPPESAHEVRVRMPAEDAGGTLSGVRTLVVGGELRAGRIETGLVEPLGKVPIRAGRVLALPRGFEPIAADPLGSLGKAVQATAPIHVLVAAEFIPAKERVEAMKLLADGLATADPALRPSLVNAVRTIRRAAAGDRLQPLAEPLVFALRGHPDRAEAAMDGLSALTGVSLAPDVRLWEDWWRREARPDAAVPGEDEPLPRRGEGAKGRAPVAK